MRHRMRRLLERQRTGASAEPCSKVAGASTRMSGTGRAVAEHRRLRSSGIVGATITVGSLFSSMRPPKTRPAARVRRYPATSRSCAARAGALARRAARRGTGCAVRRASACGRTAGACSSARCSCSRSRSDAGTVMPASRALFGGGAVERMLTHQQLIGDAGERVDVVARIRLGAIVHLGAGIRRRERAEVALPVFGGLVVFLRAPRGSARCRSR